VRAIEQVPEKREILQSYIYKAHHSADNMHLLAGTTLEQRNRSKYCFGTLPDAIVINLVEDEGTIYSLHYPQVEIMNTKSKSLPGFGVVHKRAGRRTTLLEKRIFSEP
jgi:hypothetical protein